MDIFESWIVSAPIVRYGLTTEAYPENTIAAYDNAIKQNCPILICAQSLDDETIICFPYKNVSALTNGDGYVQTLKFDDIKDLTILETEHKIVKLEDAIKFIKNKVPIMINIFNEGKVGKMESEIFNLVKDLKTPVAIVSANPESVKWFKDNAPQVIRGIKSGKFEAKTYGSYKTKKLAKLKYNKICEPDFIMYNACDLPNRFVKKFNYMPIIAYNIKTEQEYLEAVKHYDNVICSGFIPQI